MSVQRSDGTDFEMALGKLIKLHEHEGTDAIIDALDLYVQLVEGKRGNEGRKVSADTPEPPRPTGSYAQ